MSRQTDLDDAQLRRWLDDGADVAPERFVQAALDRIEITRQRRPWPLLGRFTMPAQKYAPYLGIAGAAVIAVALSMAFLGPPAGDRGPDDATPTPSARSSPAEPASIRGAITQTETDCAISGIADLVEPGSFAISLSNDTPAQASFDMFKITGEGTYADMEALIAEERRLADAGEPFLGPPSWALSAASSGFIEPGQSIDLTGTLTDGSYAVVCLWKYDQSEDPVRPFAVVGPIHVGVCPTWDAACLGPLAPGTHTTGEFSPRFSFTVPAGWEKGLDVPTAFNLGATAEPSGFMGVWPDFAAAVQDACRRAQEPGVGRTASELIDWLAEHPGLVTTDPAPITIGDYEGQAITIETDPAWDDPCPGEVSLFVATADDIGWITIRDAAQANVAILEIGDGRTLTVLVEADKAAFDAFMEMAAPLIESFDFTP